MAADVTRADDCRRTADAAIEHFGRLDTLVNNAAIYIPEGNVVDTPEETWDLIMGINLKGMMLSAKYAIPRMIETGGGSVINLSSNGGLRASRNARVTYHTSKGAAIALTTTMAAQHGRENVRVNCIAPGGIDTPHAGQRGRVSRSEIQPPGYRGHGLGHRLGGGVPGQRRGALGHRHSAAGGRGQPGAGCRGRHGLRGLSASPSLEFTEEA